MTTNAFAVPRPLVAARRKRKAEPETEGGWDASIQQSSYFTADEYARFSIRGDAHESSRYQHEERLRQTLLTDAASSEPEASAETDQDDRLRRAAKIKSKHLVELVVSWVEKNVDVEDSSNRSRILMTDNARRRISALTVDDHEEYLALVRKRNDAQRRGLPLVLALSPDETSRLRGLKQRAGTEQAEFFKHIQHIMAAEEAKHEASVPEFAVRKFEEMRTRCSNDIRRLYPQHFEKTISLPINSITDVDNGSAAAGTVKHVSEVFNFGQECLIDTSKCSRELHIPGMSDNSDSIQQSSSWTQLEPISADPYAEQLMLKHNCDVAVSSSTLLTLFDVWTPSSVSDMTRRWSIPMKSRFVVHAGASRKLVYLDRPLLDGDITARDKIAICGRSLVLDCLRDEANGLNQHNGRTAYHVWLIGGTRVLVRTTTHVSALLRSDCEGEIDFEGAREDGSTGAKRVVPLSLFVKVDYQDLGLGEQFTASERCRMWLHSWIRGNARVVVARLNPKSCAVHEWESYSLGSLVYGCPEADKARYADYFDPMRKFKTVANVLTALCDVPNGNYVLRSSVGCKGPPQLDLFASTNGPVESLSAEQQDSSHFDLFDHVQKSCTPQPDQEHRPTMVLPEWYVSDRIPYTYRTGTYCRPFFQTGVCPLLANGSFCECRHLRLAASDASLSRWCFEDFNSALSKAKKHHGRNPFATIRPAVLEPDFRFCTEGKLIPSVVMTNPNATVRCPKAPGECQLRHFSVHEVAERVAHAILRDDRRKRKHSKTNNQRRRGTDQQG